MTQIIDPDANEEYSALTSSAKMKVVETSKNGTKLNVCRVEMLNAPIQNVTRYIKKK